VISSDGTTIAFDRLGQGPPVILVGGAFQYRAFDPRTGELAKLLADAGFTVYHYDRRGRGESTNGRPYSVQREVEDIDALVGDAGAPVALFGMSSGAALAIAAVASGVGVTKLAVYEPPFVVDDSRPRVPGDTARRIAELADSGRRGEAVELFMTAAVAVPAEMVTQMKQAPVWAGFTGMAHTLAYDVEVLGDYEVPAAASELRIPVLVGDGDASPAWMRSAAAALADAVPNAQRITFRGQTHDIAPELLAPALAGFFNQEDES
jgi:pimeloyl-ACP methyl ester carboxylesterase